MSLTAPGCSMSDVIKAEVEQKLAALPEVREVHVEIVFDPPWNAGMMSEGAKLQLGFDSDYGTPSLVAAKLRIVALRSLQGHSLTVSCPLPARVFAADIQIVLLAAQLLQLPAPVERIDESLRVAPARLDDNAQLEIDLRAQQRLDLSPRFRADRLQL